MQAGCLSYHHAGLGHSKHRLFAAPCHLLHMALVQLFPYFLLSCSAFQSNISYSHCCRGQPRCRSSTRWPLPVSCWTPSAPVGLPAQPATLCLVANSPSKCEQPSSELSHLLLSRATADFLQEAPLLLLLHDRASLGRHLKIAQPGAASLGALQLAVMLLFFVGFSPGLDVWDLWNLSCENWRSRTPI